MDRATFAAFTVLNSKLNRILKLLGEDVMAEIDALEEAVARVESTSDTILAKVDQLKQQGGVDPARVQAAADRLTAVAEKLSAGAAE